MLKRTHIILALTLAFLALPAQAASNAGSVREVGRLGQAVERELPPDAVYRRWVQDEGSHAQSRGDRIELKEVVQQRARTVKLRDLVQPIPFDSGRSAIPERYVELLREVLAGMGDRHNVRLHFIGHSDDAPLSPALAASYGDNTELSRERAGSAAGFFKHALGLAPEAVSYEGRGEHEPIASNDTEAGRARNRRVEVEVWYDRMEDQLGEQEVVVREALHRVKVCRIETVCMLRYKDGHAHRARVRNLMPPLYYGQDAVAVPVSFQQQVLQTLNDLERNQGKRNVEVRFVGYTDSGPLQGRDERIYGDHLTLSRAQARRVALAVQQGLALPTAKVQSEGRGSLEPAADNDTASGRAQNRRVEVEFWYDDPLHELPGEPQLCPRPGAPETVTRVYEPPSGPLAPVLFERGQPQLTQADLERLGQVMGEVSGKDNVRLRFIGYTETRRLDRRTALVYGDDVGLSTARARRAAERAQAALRLTDRQLEVEGRGYLQAADVVSEGFLEADTSHVEVQVVYDELIALDPRDSMDITPITREVTPVNPFALNLMRITVDGTPIDDPNKSLQDVQRCTDVALDHADVQFQFDSLAIKPRLNVTAWPNVLRFADDPQTELPDNLVQFRAYTNYPAFIERAEVRVFAHGESTRAAPLAVVPVPLAGVAEWQPSLERPAAPGRELQYLLRVYDAQGRFDETAPQALWVVDEVTSALQRHERDEELQAGYGQTRLAVQNIPLSGGSIRVLGQDIPAGHTVWVAGSEIPLGRQGDFVAEKILPAGLHTVEVALIDASGNGQLFLRDLELKSRDWFYVGIADLTLARSHTSGPAQLVSDRQRYRDELAADGRLAGYLRGRFGADWQLTASADTREGPVRELFSNFMDKSPEALFRRIDPDHHYPTYGDDGTVEEGAPTSGKLYVKLQRREDYGLWGNFKIAYVENSLAHVDRGLYGANVHLRSEQATGFGERRFLVDGFAAQPGTAGRRDEFRGTGGSLYFLRHQDILVGSERIRIEVRDGDSGLVRGVKNLVPGLDYSIEYLQGRVLLAQPLAATASDSMLVQTGAGAGDEAYLVVRYEFTPGFDDLDTLSSGGRTHYWLGDHVRLGLTASRDRVAGETSSLGGADLILRLNEQTWLKLEGSRSEGVGVDTLHSWDGGFSFDTSAGVAVPGEGASAYRIDASIALSDLHSSTQGQVTLYRQAVGAGYQAPGLNTDRDTDQYGGSLAMPLTDSLAARLKADRRVQTQGVETSAVEANLDYAVTEHWTLGSGLRHDRRQDNSLAVPLTQREGERTDAALRVTYDSHQRWMSYGYVQDTVSRTGNRESNARVGAGGALRVSDRFTLDGEASTGDLGAAGRLGLDYLYSDRTTVYSSYGLENERSDQGLRARRGSLTAGMRMHYSDTASVYVEERYSHGDVPRGLTHSAGVDLAPFERWSFGVNADYGTLRDPLTSAELERLALGARVGYGFERVRLAHALEYRDDRIEAPDQSRSERVTWLTRNSVRYQINPDWRFLGKLDHARSDSTQGAFFDGRYTEAGIGYAYRPVHHDRLNALLKYTYFYNLPSAGQVTAGSATASYIQKSHILAADAMYDLTPRWAVGGKYAYRLGQLAMDRAEPEFFDSRAHLYIVRADWRFVRRWSALVEGRLLDLPDAGDSRTGALLALNRHFGDNIRLGVGYNFAEFSDDLTNLDYNHRGVFINIVGSL